jgi:transcriptional regulator with XRE-family HTH domain
LPPFAATLKSLRASAGLTQEQLAERAGLHLGAVFKLEQGRREPAWATVQALAAALGVSCEVFMDRKDRPKKVRSR